MTNPQTTLQITLLMARMRHVHRSEKNQIGDKAGGTLISKELASTKESSKNKTEIKLYRKKMILTKTKSMSKSKDQC